MRGFAGRVVSVGPPHPEGVPTVYVMQLFAVELTYLDKSRCTVQKRLSSRKTISSKRCRGGKGFVRRKSGRFAKLPMIEGRSLPEAVADAENDFSRELPDAFAGVTEAGPLLMLKTPFLESALNGFREKIFRNTVLYVYWTRPSREEIS